MMNKMNKANPKGVAGMTKANTMGMPANQGTARKPVGMAKGGLVKSTGKMNTGIKSCGHSMKGKK